MILANNKRKENYDYLFKYIIYLYEIYAIFNKYM